MSRGIENLEGACAKSQDLAAAKRANILCRHRKKICEERLHLAAVKLARAGEQAGGILQMGRADFMDVHREAGIFADQRTRRYGVIEMDVRKQDGVEIGEREAHRAKFSPQIGQRGFGAGIDQYPNAAKIQERRCDGARTAGPVQVDGGMSRLNHPLSVKRKGSDTEE